MVHLPKWLKRSAKPLPSSGPASRALPVGLEENTLFEQYGDAIASLGWTRVSGGGPEHYRLRLTKSDPPMKTALAQELSGRGFAMRRGEQGTAYISVSRAGKGTKLDDLLRERCPGNVPESGRGAA